MKKYTFNFKTELNKNEINVINWYVVDIENKNKIYAGENIKSFIDFTEKNNGQYYYYDLKIGGEFIIYYLLNNNYTYIHNRLEATEKNFTAIINELNTIYSIEIIFKAYNKKNVTSKKYIKSCFYDAKKIINLNIQDIEKNYNINIDNTNETLKTAIIIAEALTYTFKEGLTKITRASCALEDFKKVLGKNKFTRIFPSLNYYVDKDIRQAYFGGCAYLNPVYINKEIKNGCSIDLNSMYSYIMLNRRLPHDTPIYFEGAYKKDENYNLYIQMFKCSFELKKGQIPTIKRESLYSLDNEVTEYLTTSDGETKVLCLTNIDLDIFLKHYDVEDLEFISGWKFKSVRGYFDKYINKWYAKKQKATIEGNKGARQEAKIMLNSLTGKFAKKTIGVTKTPFIDNEGIIKYYKNDPVILNGVYSPVSIFINAYGRELLFNSIDKIKEYSLNKYNKDAFIYCDTDGIKTTLKIEELKEILDINNSKIGAFKIEDTFKKARFIKPKCYIQVTEEDKKENLKIVCAGLPEEAKTGITYNNFKVGFSTKCFLEYKHYKGGVRLEEKTFTIKDNDIKKAIANF